jgi:hypothetical protein
MLVVSPYERDANSFWRCMGPLTYLQKHSNDEIEITVSQMSNGIAWCDVMQYDLVFLHRPCRPDDLTVMKIAHNCGIPTWIDYDDWLFNIPSWNRSSQTYMNPGIQDLMAQCLVSADVVTCSTQALLDKFKQVNPNAKLLKNAYRSDLYPYRTEELPERNHLAYWRGSDTHDGDLLSVKEGFQDLGAKILFLGGVSWILLSSLQKQAYEIIGNQDVIMYYKYLYDLRAKVCVFPLVDCFFNRCKSNIAYIEAIHAGAICVAPNMPEWKQEGVITYEAHNSDSFREAVNYALEMTEGEHTKILESSFQSMKHSYDIQVINSLRLEIVHGLKKDITRPSPFDQLAALKALSILKEDRKNGETSGLS